MDTAPTFYPLLRYRDARAAIAFLTTAFGFAEREVTVHDGVVVHAELTYGTGIVMLGTLGVGDPLWDLTPTGVYVAVDDPDAHHARAVAAGADIVMPLTDQDYGSREYAARDPEGNVWSFGTYRPAPKE
ncbi:VOC family protein [Jiangella rhizosphaerae]|nr:VOC family protein [Jiangella rhizosphaerae]